MSGLQDDRRSAVDLENLMPMLTAALGYLLLASGTIALTSNGRDHATIWPADAVILALLLPRPRSHWPAILISGWAANLLANVLTRGWAPGIVLYGAINMGQVVLAAHMLKPRFKPLGILADVPALLRFTLWAGLVAPMFGAAMGAGVTWLNYAQPFGQSFVLWFTSNALGLLIFTPFLTALFGGDYVRSFRAKSMGAKVETLLLLLVVIAISLVVFCTTRLPVLFVPLVVVVLMTFRLGRLEAKAGVMAVAVIGMIASLNGLGPIAAIEGGRAFQVVFFQLYLVTLLLATLPIATIMASRQEALLRLREKEESLRLVMAHSANALLSFDPQGVCRFAEGPVAQVLGVSAESMNGTSIAALGDMSGAVLQAYSAALRAPGEEARAEFIPLARPGMTIEVSFKAMMVGEVLLGTVANVCDVSKRKAQEAALMRAADADGLTGLLNRSGFMKRLRHRLSTYPEPTALALIDVDRFKRVNDEHGHQVGDEILIEIAAALKSGARTNDYVGRLGGDEFVIMFASGCAEAERACNRIARNIISAPHQSPGGQTIHSSISCGLAEFHVGMSAEQLMHAADMALYEAKRGGRNQVRSASSLGNAA
jgi:diguanylate cyclase (GGDEF)-like protein/PAS domain S-box-containing protein